VDALEELMSDPLDDRLSQLVDWLVGNVIQRPRSHPRLAPIKQSCKLRDVLNAALRRADGPLLRARVPAPARRPESSVLVLPSARPATRASPSSATVRPATVTTPLLPRSAVSSSSAATPARLTVQPTPAPVFVSQPVVAPVSAAAAQRHLIIDCAERAPAQILFRYDQDTVSDYIRGPVGFFGFCNAATGRFLQEPDTIERYLKSTVGRTTLCSAQSAYESVGKADTFVTRTYSLTHLGTVGPHTLTPQDVLSCVDKATGTRIALYLVGAPDGGGHAIGILKEGSTYRFLDVNEGCVRLGSRDALWRFLFYYITDQHQGLKNDYPQFCMAYWA